MPTTLGTPVRPPVLAPPTISLITAARLRDETDERWGNGVSFAPFNCGTSRSGAYDPCNSSYTKTITGVSGDTEFKAFAVWGSDECSSFGFESRDFEERAIMVLRATEAKTIEQEMWLGTVTGNPRFANGSASVVGGGPYDVGKALEKLEQALADGTVGNQCMIHMRPQLLGPLLTKRLVRREGNLYFTYMDNVVVPGRGYPGTGPTGQAVGATEWMYASGVVEIFRGPIHQFALDGNQRIDRVNNNVAVFADRMILGMFDPCINFAVEVNESSVV